MYRGEIWWATLADPIGSEPGYRRPVIIIQDDAFNRSTIQTIIVVIITSNLQLAQAPGNVFLQKKDTGLSRDSVANVSQVITIDKSFLTERITSLSLEIQEEIDNGLRLVLYL